MPGHIYNTIRERALDQHGLVRATDARELGIDPRRLVEMERRGTIERVARGVYRFKDIPADRFQQYMAAVLWPSGAEGVLGHETALDLYDVCDVNPARIHVTVPADHRIRRQDVPAVYEFHHRDLAEEDITHLEGLPVVTLKRAILDGIEAHLRTGLIVQAIDTAHERGMLRRRDAEELRELATGAAA